MSLFKLALCLCILFLNGARGDSINLGGDPNITGFIPTVSISRRTILESTDINLVLKVYQGPINATTNTTIKTLSGSTNINSTNRCIAWGVSFDLWGALPIENQQATGNGGCDALLGNECSMGIIARLQQSLGNISGTACGVSIPDLIRNPPQGCSRNNNTIYSISTNTFLSNGSFMISNSTPTDSTKSWIYLQSDSASATDYNQLMKYNVFTYFVSRDYGLNRVSSAIACLSVYNKTETITTTKPTGSGQSTMQTESLLLLISMIAVVGRIST